MFRRSRIGYYLQLPACITALAHCTPAAGLVVHAAACLLYLVDALLAALVFSHSSAPACDSVVQPAHCSSYYLVIVLSYRSSWITAVQLPQLWPLLYYWLQYSQPYCYC